MQINEHWFCAIKNTNSRAVANLLAKQRIDTVRPDVKDIFRRGHKIDGLCTEILGRHKTECKTRIQLNSIKAVQVNHKHGKIMFC